MIGGSWQILVSGSVMMPLDQELQREPSDSVRREPRYLISVRLTFRSARSIFMK